MRSNRAFGQVRVPTARQLQEYGARHRFTLDDDLAGQLVPVLAEMLEVFNQIDELPQPPNPATPVTIRDAGREPLTGEDPFNAFIRFCHVEGTADGPLTGLTAAIKDSIAVAGMPVTNGSRMLPALVATEDAVVVERLLEAGATIVGKTNMENMGLGMGLGSAYGPALNPNNPGRGTGGSSSGSAAAVASGMADFALGADSAGSVRIPAAWCGLVGMKATHGLVPSYGLTSMDHTLDHIGPLTRSVELNAKVLGATAGPDWRDPQPAGPLAERQSYADALGRDVQGLRFGVVDESLDASGTTPDVLAAFHDAVAVLKTAGATVDAVSVPLWQAAWAIELGVFAFNGRATVDSGGTGYFRRGRIDIGAAATRAAQARISHDDLAIMARLMLLISEHMREEYLGVHYGKAQNLRIELGNQVQAALDGRAALLTPTTPTVAAEVTTERQSLLSMLPHMTGSAVLNTCPLNLTGHPALTVPSGPAADGLPAGIQFIARHFDEPALYQAGSVVEAADLWRLPSEPAAQVPR